ncbi:unnamed protein product [Albugo candida]|uniref:Uncharacterized protein n=1 Tax=Albugo candida TaxID=65357 RepID=A0A024G105_9STRA|nr:unnamed protein product [Albugo candida]|eukprot:CCI40335.1 unnamed protein product [Albugo candida]
MGFIRSQFTRQLKYLTRGTGVIILEKLTFERASGYCYRELLIQRFERSKSHKSQPGTGNNRLFFVYSILYESFTLIILRVGAVFLGWNSIFTCFLHSKIQVHLCDRKTPSHIVKYLNSRDSHAMVPLGRSASSMLNSPSFTTFAAADWSSALHQHAHEYAWLLLSYFPINVSVAPEITPARGSCHRAESNVCDDASSSRISFIFSIDILESLPYNGACMDTSTLKLTIIN